MSQPKRFSDFCEERKPLDGSKVKLESILDQEIIVTDFRISGSKYNNEKQCLTLQFKMKDISNILFTGSKVLMDQIEKNKDEIPFITVIKKIDRYYIMT